MMFSDKAFAIWMGHAGEDTQVFTQDDAVIDTRSFEHTQVLAIARRDVMSIETMANARRQAQSCEPEGIAA
jgi:hypothetical protein